MPVPDKQTQDEVALAKPLKFAGLGAAVGAAQGILTPGKTELAKLSQAVLVAASEFGIRANVRERSRTAFVGGAIGAIVCGVGSYIFNWGPDASADRTR